MTEALTAHTPLSDVAEPVDTLARKLSNWGRWGASDELGTVNLITPHARARAAACVHTGEAISLVLPLRPDYPQAAGGGRFNASTR
jgi:hypothetical protein